MGIEAYCLYRCGYRFHGDTEEAEEIFKLCRVAVVQGTGKWPYWKIIERRLELTPKQYSALREMIEQGVEFEDVKVERGLKWLTHPITHRKISMLAIKELFPECKTMPYVYACDYVRDRL